MVSTEAQPNINNKSGDARSLGATLTLEDTSEGISDASCQARTQQLLITEKKLLTATLALTEALQALGNLQLYALMPEIGQGINFYDEVSRFEATLIAEALELTQGRQKQAAELLDLNASTLHAMMKRYNISGNSASELKEDENKDNKE